MACKKTLGKAAPKRKLHESSYQKGLIQRNLATEACKVPEGPTYPQTISTNVEESVYEILDDPNMDLNQQK